MDKKEAISTIENLYPADSQFPDTNNIGRELLLESIMEFGWRELPESILVKYAEKCIERDEDCIRMFNERYK